MCSYDATACPVLYMFRQPLWQFRWLVGVYMAMLQSRPSQQGSQERDCLTAAVCLC